MAIGRTIRNTAISVIVLIIVVVGGGVAYTYYLGPDGSQAQNQATEKAAPAAPVIKTTKPSANSTIGVSVAALSSPVAPGDNSMLTIRTLPTAKCSVVMAYGSLVAKDSGLAPKTADEFGSAAWSWTIDKTAPLGTWPIKVTCAYNGRSAVVQGDLVVAKPDANASPDSVE